MSEVRTVLVPEGLAGNRVDAGVARMFGFSRTRAAELCAAGLVLIDGSAASKSDRLTPDSMLEVTIPAEVDPLEVVPEIVEGSLMLASHALALAGVPLARGWRSDRHLLSQ